MSESEYERGGGEGLEEGFSEETTAPEGESSEDTSYDESSSEQTEEPNASTLPHYDAETDTLWISQDEIPALTGLMNAGSVDAWLAEMGVDPAVCSDDETPSV